MGKNDLMQTSDRPVPDSSGNPDSVAPSDLNPTLEDVMKVLKELDGDFNGPTGPSESREISNLNSAQPNRMSHPPQGMDVTAVANSRLLKLVAEQVRIEQRYERLSRRIDFFRRRQLGNLVSQELSQVQDYVHQVTPSLPKIDVSNLDTLHPLAEGMALLPSAPSTEALMSSLPSSGTKKTAPENKKTEVAPSFASDEVKQKCDEALGQLSARVKHFIQSYDSEATESSSGGESCDEMDHFPEENSYYMPIKKRAKYVWLSERAKVASKWTWLSAQISDLEHQIRQQTELYQQIRAEKGTVMVGKPMAYWPPQAQKPLQAVVRPDRDVPLDCNPVTKDYSRVDIDGKKIIPNEPSPSGPLDQSDADDSTLGCCRTKPIKMVRRQIISTKELYKTVSRATKESSVSCECVKSTMWCSICFGRVYHSQIPNPLIHERNQCIALLDHSFHKVLSSKEDIQLQHQISGKLDDHAWLAGPFEIKGPEIKDANLDKKLKKSSQSDEEDGSDSLKKKMSRKTDKDGQLKISKQTDMRRRKTLNFHHYSDDRGTAMQDQSSDVDAISRKDEYTPFASSSVLGSNQRLHDHFRKKKDTAYDIDDIVIPSSIASASRVEKLQYKEILTPTWREVIGPLSREEEKELDEDISENIYELRHSKAEVEEQKRWRPPLFKTSGSQKSRNRRQDSCQTEASNNGCNTPDPGVVDTVEVCTRPSTPISGNEDTNSTSLQAANIRRGYRTSMVTRSRDRNPLKYDHNSHYAYPTPEQQQELHEEIMERLRLPYKSRVFPLTDEEYAIMVQDSASFMNSK